ncbi:MAG TPA: hypothetical protein VKB88_06945, partial [Bryobacteraceae bacterium]|nr:hypothetical protein [Bryobacteraceae bacterium]
HGYGPLLHRRQRRQRLSGRGHSSRKGGLRTPANPSTFNFRNRYADLQQGNLSGGLFQSSRLGPMN